MGNIVGSHRRDCPFCCAVSRPNPIDITGDRGIDHHINLNPMG
jgi:hypothetical protein